ncbi:MAG: pilus assembly protein [Lachnospiraceae bacterium]|nr:pilus assembly protein [Lachnospiraceae bacterium]
MLNKLRGSITIEMTYIFPIVLMIILILCTLSLYLSDIVSMRAFLQSYVLIEAEGNKTESELEKELKNKLKNYTYITEITSVDVEKENDKLKVNVSYNPSIKILDIKLKDKIEVTGYSENNREFILRSKVFMDVIKDMGGVNIWKWFIRRT